MAITCNSSGFGTSSGGVLTLSGTPLSGTATGQGTATFARITTSGGTPIMDVDVGTSGATFNLTTTSITNGLVVTITSGTITEA